MLCQGAARDHRARVPQRGHVHVPRAPVGVRRARLDGLLRGERLVESGSLRSEARRRALAAVGARADRSLLVGAVVALRLDRRLARSTSSGRTRRRATSSTSAGSSSEPGEIKIRVTNPQRDDDHDRLGDRRRRDRPVLRSTGPRRSAAALGDDRRPVRLGRRTSRSPSASRARPGSRRRRRSRPPSRRLRPRREELPRLRADRLPRRRRSRRARARLAPVPARRAMPELAGRVHGADRRAAHVPRARGARRRRSSCRRRCPSGLGGLGLVLLGVARPTSR